MPGFVDVHSHMIPSGDDGVRRVEDGLRLLREAAQRGTRVLYGTPHLNRLHEAGPARVARTEEAYAAMVDEAAGFGLELRLGWELGPERSLLRIDPTPFRMQGLDAALLEFPLPHIDDCELDLLVACAEHLQQAGLTPILAHPERCSWVQDEPSLAIELRERGWPLQVNATSLSGDHDPGSFRCGWDLVERGLCDLVASDAHGSHRPPFLDRAYETVAARAGRAAADRLLGGAALEPLAQPSGQRSA